MSLIEQMRRARQTLQDIDGHQFTIRRPTPMEWLEVPVEWATGVPESLSDEQRNEWLQKQTTLSSAKWRKFAWCCALRFVDGWNLTELDLIPGGTGAPAPFSIDVLEEWLRDHPAALNGIAMAVFNAWCNYAATQAEDGKKSQSGTSQDP